MLKPGKVCHVRSDQISWDQPMKVSPEGLWHQSLSWMPTTLGLRGWWSCLLQQGLLWFSCFSSRSIYSSWTLLRRQRNVLNAPVSRWNEMLSLWWSVSKETRSISLSQLQIEQPSPNSGKGSQPCSPGRGEPSEVAAGFRPELKKFSRVVFQEKEKPTQFRCWAELWS